MGLYSKNGYSSGRGPVVQILDHEEPDSGGEGSSKKKGPMRTTLGVILENPNNGCEYGDGREIGKPLCD